MSETILSILIILLVTICTTFVSLSGGFLLLSNSKLTRYFQKYGAIFAAIVLLYATFFDVIPEVLEANAVPVWQIPLFIAAGFLICFILNTLGGHLHRHGDKHALRSKKQAISMLIVDSIHTALDGVILGLSFASSLGTGITTATATAAHEIPQEIGDFSIMLRSKMPKRQIAKVQIISGLLLIPFTLLSYFIGDFISGVMPVILCFIAGSFLFIAWGEVAPGLGKIWRRAKKTVKKSVN